MEPLTTFLTLMTIILGLILSALALGNRFIKWLKKIIVEVLQDVRLIRHGEKKGNWPNGWKNLPDLIDALYDLYKERRRGD